MKHITNAILISLFVIGVLVVPTVHRTHCDDHHATREAAKCPICQLAHTSVITTAAVIVPIAGFIKLGDAVLPQSFITSSPWRDPTQARAPPVA
ncbi:MAG: DUF2946 family protein [Kiritimatiellia bacterium]|jgi:hypothetical protein